MAIEYQDPRSGCRLAVADDQVDDLLRHLFRILFAPDWSHGVEHAVDAALIGRYYERGPGGSGGTAARTASRAR